jgi:hypothetical protein
MRVLRPKRQTDPHRAPAERRLHGMGRAAAPAPAASAADPPSEPELDPELRAEERMRASGGPEDRAFYRCTCGYAFEADVSTSVDCPHCGSGQAW